MIEEKEQKLEEQLEKRRLDGDLAHLMGIRFFPGSVAEYQATVGYEVEVIDTGDIDIGVRFQAFDRNEPGMRLYPYELPERVKKLVDARIEAVVNVVFLEHQVFSSLREVYYGLPVARKKS